jgi:hypothetical protein
MEPPRPFGKTSAIVCARTRQEAAGAVSASPGYPVTATVVDDPVSFSHRCHHPPPAPPSSGPSTTQEPTTREIEEDVERLLRA